MRDRRFNRLLAATVSTLGIVLSAGAGATSFNFDYQASGDRSVQPYQVFDDGQATYLQFRQGTNIQAVFVVDAQGTRRRVDVSPDGPYLKIDSVAARIDLVGDRATATLQTSKRSAPAAPARELPPQSVPVAVAPPQVQHTYQPQPQQVQPSPQQVIPVQHTQPSAVAAQAGTVVYSRPATRTAPVYESPVYYAAPAPAAPQTAYAQPQPQRIIEAAVPQPVHVPPQPAPVMQRQDDVAELRQQVAQLTQLVMALAKRMDAQTATSQIGAQPVQQPRLVHASATAAPVAPRTVAAPAQPIVQAAPQPQQPRVEQPQAAPARAVQMAQQSAPVPTQAPVQQDNPVVANAQAQQPVAPAPVPEPTQPRPALRPATYEITVHSGQRLSDAVRRFVSVHSLDLDWDTGGADFEVKFGFKLTGGSMEDVLLAVLSPFKLSAVTRTGNGVVSVTRSA